MTINVEPLKCINYLVKLESNCWALTHQVMANVDKGAVNHEGKIGDEEKREKSLHERTMEVLRLLIENKRVDELLKVFSKLEGQSESLNICYNVFHRCRRCTVCTCS